METTDEVGVGWEGSFVSRRELLSGPVTRGQARAKSTHLRPHGIPRAEPRHGADVQERAAHAWRWAAMASVVRARAREEERWSKESSSNRVKEWH